MHTHQSLFRGEENAFFDADDEFFLSPIAKSFIAGQLRHAREMSCVFAQWSTPTSAWCRDMRRRCTPRGAVGTASALIRVPVYPAGKERATRVEIRCPDPACNPYLTFAALLHAGHDGIEKGYELPPP